MTTVFIISAPSGSGKSTLVGRLMQDIQGLMFSVSYTPRLPRGNEQEGGHYHYISKQEFEERIGHRFERMLCAIHPRGSEQSLCVYPIGVDVQPVSPAKGSARNR